MNNLRNLASRKNLTRIVFALAGAIAGYAYYHFVGCATGTCPITGNPYMSTAYGSLMGYTLGMIKED